MTPHRWATIFLLLVLTGLLALELVISLPWWSYALPVLLYAVAAGIGSSRIGSDYHMKVLCHGTRDRPRVALSFDDGPHPEVTPQVLDLLQEKGVKAAFFLIGERVEANPELVDRIHREGHLIGNHSWSHAFFFDLFPAKRMARELKRTSERIAAITGTYPLAFRPPYGVTNPMLRKAVQKIGLVPIGWDLRSFDTAKGETVSKERVIKCLRSGSLILLHDTDPKVVRILPQILDAAQEKGLKWVRLDQLLQKELSHEARAA